MQKKYYVFELNMTGLNILTIILLFILFIITSIFMEGEINYILVFALCVPYFMLHEVLHSIGYVLHGAKWKNVSYGMHLEKGILCCICKQNISKKCILISLLYPFFFIGVVTYFIGIIFNLNELVLLSIMNIAGCSGDLAMFYSLSRLKNYEYSEYDNPTGFALYTSEDLSKKKLFSLKFVETKNELEKNIKKKIEISKPSIIILLIFLGALILSII